MRRLVFLSLFSAAIGACGQSILAPTPSAQEPIRQTPMHDNIPATFANDPFGPIVWLCATQPREYTLPDGRRQLEEDHYLQYTTCPSIPIK